MAQSADPVACDNPDRIGGLAEHDGEYKVADIDASDARVVGLIAVVDAPLRIEVEPTARRQKWIARFGGRVLCVSSWPFVKSARVLLGDGYPADAQIEMWRRDADEWDLRGRLDEVAGTRIDGERARKGPVIVFPSG